MTKDLQYLEGSLAFLSSSAARIPAQISLYLKCARTVGTPRSFLLGSLSQEQIPNTLQLLFAGCEKKKDFPFLAESELAWEEPASANTKLEHHSLHEAEQQGQHRRDIPDKAAGCVFIIDLSNCLDLYPFLLLVHWLTCTFRRATSRPPSTIAAALNYYHRYTRVARGISDPFVFIRSFSGHTYFVLFTLSHRIACLVTCTTRCAFLGYFFIKKCLPTKMVATACVFIACKAQETLRAARDLANVAYNILNSKLLLLGEVCWQL